MNRKTIGSALALLLLIGSAGIWTLFADGESAEFTHIKQLQNKLINDDTLSDAEREAGWREVKKNWSSFSEEEQRQLKLEGNKKKQQNIDAYFALEAEEERLAHIDKVIDEWDAAMKDGKTKRRNPKDESAAKKKQANEKGGGKSKQYDQDSLRDGLRDHLDSKTADERAKERVYWTEVKKRWAERHGSRK